MTSTKVTINFRFSPRYPPNLKFVIFDCLPTVLTIDNLHCEENYHRIGGKGAKKGQIRIDTGTHLPKNTRRCVINHRILRIRGGDKK